MSTLATRTNGATTGLAAIESRLPELIGISAYKSDPTRMFKLMRMVYEKQPELSRCSTTSLFQCFADCVRLDLDPGKEAHIIPFKGEATLIVGYSGLVKVLVRSGVVAWVNPTPVFQGEPFRVLSGTVDKIEHERRADIQHDRNALVAVHTKVAFNDARTDPMVRVMYKDQIEAIRKRSKKGEEHPWIGQYTYVSMALKTGIRDTAKYLNLPPKAREELEIIDRQEFDIEGASRSTRVVAVGESASERVARMNAEPASELVPVTGDVIDVQPHPVPQPEAPKPTKHKPCPVPFTEASDWRNAMIEEMVDRKYGDAKACGKHLDATLKARGFESYLSTPPDRREAAWIALVTSRFPKPASSFAADMDAD